MRRYVIVFARAPALGTGKRRLARDIGDVAAMRFERQMLDSVSGDALLDLIAHERHQVRLEVADAAQNIRMRETEIVVAGETGYDDSWLVDRIFSYCAFEDVLAPYLVGDAIGHIGA